MSGLLEIIGVNGGRLSIDKKLKTILEAAHAGAKEDLLVSAFLFDDDVDIAGPKLIHIKTPAASAFTLEMAITLKALTAGVAKLYEGTEIVPVGTSTAFTLANELRTDFAAHAARANRHTTGQQSTATMPAAATNTATLLALTNALTTFYAAHNADAILAAAWAWHSAQGVTHPLASTAAVATVAGAVAQLNDIKTQFNAHELIANTHAGVGTVAGDQIAAAAAALTGGLDFGTVFTDHFRNNRDSAAAVGSYFFEDPETVGAGGNGTLLTTKRVLANVETPLCMRKGAEIILKPSTSYMLNFTSDADNNKLWFEAEYFEVPA